MQGGNNQTNWTYNPNDGVQSTPDSTPSRIKPVTWTASEYVSHDKTAGWFVLFSAIAIFGIGIVFFITRDLSAVALLGLLCVAFGIFAARKPEVLDYKIDGSIIQIGRKSYPMSIFRSFTISQEGAIRSVSLLPLKRFMPTISVYYEPSDEDKILDILSMALPYEQRSVDPIDRLMAKIRF